jgi:hypothetical protein
MPRAMNVLALVKNEERYVFLYDDTSIDKLLQTLGQYASDPDLSFSWYDAAVLSQRVRKFAADAGLAPMPPNMPHPAPRWETEPESWPDSDAA